MASCGHGQRTAIGHGVTAVDGQIHDRLLELRGVTSDGQILPEIGGGDCILGDISPTSADVDLYRFTWQGGDLKITTFGPPAGGQGPQLENTQLHLFDSALVGIGANDDRAAGGLRSSIHLTLAAGDYWIGISAFDVDPNDGVATELFGVHGSDFLDIDGNLIMGPDDPALTLGGWAGPAPTGSGSYKISFEGAMVSQIPAPATLPIWLCLGTVLFLRRRR